MESSVIFNQKLGKGQVIERGVVKLLHSMMPDCDIKNTNQEWGSAERDEYNLCDCVVIRDGKTILGIECKRSAQKFLKCKEFNGWDGDFNTPLNNTSIKKYEESDFPFYVLNINEFCHKAFAADIKTISKSNHDKGIRKPSGVVIYNYDSSDWMVYEETFTVRQILSDIMKKEGLC